MKINSRIKLIALSVSMIVSLGAVAAPEATVPDLSAKQEKGHYTVRQGETLAQIAARFRPADASLQETIRALVKANPKAFRNGNINFIRAGDVLVIPSSLELSKLDGQLVLDKKPAPVADSAASQVKQFPAIVAVEPKPVEPVKPVEIPKPIESKPVEDKKTAEVKASEGVIVQPVQKTEEVVVPKTASAEVVTTTTKPVQQEQASKEKSDLSSSVKQESVKQEEEGSSSLPWVILFGLVLAGLFAYNKIKNKASKDILAGGEEKEPVKETQDTVSVTGASASSVVVKEDEDSIFFSDVEQAKQPEEVPAGEVDIDLSVLGDQGGIVSSSVTNDEETNKRRDANWDEIESTDSVYEDEPQPVKTVTDDIIDVEVAVDDGVEVAEEQHKHTPLEFDLLKEAAPVEQVVEEKADSLLIETPPVFETVETVVEKTETDFELPAISEKQRLEQQEEAFNVAEPVEVVESKTESTQVFSEAESEIEQVGVQAEDDSLSLEQSDLVVESSDVTAEEDFSNTHITEADDDTVIEWDSVQFSDTDEEVGFVSESVGMTAPLEAKYELAQMYIEIGDPEAARETLNELVEEASGDILAKSKTLLAELG